MTEAEEILVTGATGLVGRRLVAALQGRGSGVRVLTRDATRARGSLEGVRAVGWNGRDAPANALEGVRGVVHLAGEPIFPGPPTAAHRRRVRASRIDSTHSLVEGMAQRPAAGRPAVLVCASAVGYYGARGEEVLTESAPPGPGFLADLCRDWEAAAASAGEHGVRVVSPRIGIVLAREGGALAALARLFRLGLGGRVGSGDQWVPWVHIDDLVGLILLALDDPSVSGPLNAVAPEPVRNRELTKTLARLVGRPALLPAPAFLVRTALRDLAGELLDSRRVVPARAQQLGFAFRHPTLESALRAEL